MDSKEKAKIAAIVGMTVLAGSLGCRAHEGHLAVNRLDAKAIGHAAIKEFDINHDGKISGEELDRCPGIKAAIEQIDNQNTGGVTANMISERIEEWQKSKLGKAALPCQVCFNGKPLAGAVIKFVPEKFLGDKFQTATATTDANGKAIPSIPINKAIPYDKPGVGPGFYRVEITKLGENIPAKYNTETILGQEVALDAKGIKEGIRFDLKD